MGDNNDQNDSVAKSYSLSRRTAWWALTVFGAVITAAHWTAVNEKKDAGSEATRADKWSGLVMILTLAFGFLSCLASHFWAKNFVDKWVGEGAVSVVVLGLYAAGMAAIQNPANEQALNIDGSIKNANLYFFSWATLIAAVYIFGSFVSIQAHFKWGGEDAPPNMSKSSDASDHFVDTSTR